MDYEKENVATLQHFITRSGFIKDRNGRLCRNFKEAQQ